MLASLLPRLPAIRLALVVSPLVAAAPAVARADAPAPAPSAPAASPGPADGPARALEDAAAPVAPVAPAASPATSPAAPPAEAATPPASPPVVAPARAARAEAADGFRFGSYGRVVAGSDLRGGKPEAVNVVAHGPRVVENSYLELDLSYGFTSPRGVALRPVVTLAFDGTLFHDTGDFDARPALRNVYVDARLSPRLSAWVGSRMYRGDDIFLFDYWPLDDLNTVGAGARYRGGPLDLAAHAGVNRLNRPFQFQETAVADPEQGAATVVQLNRQRMLGSASATYLVDRGPEAASYKVKLHGEVHGLPAGTRRRTDGTFEALPADLGTLVGVEVGVFGLAPRDAGLHRHLNLFARYATGLAAFDELAPPTSIGPDLKTSRASELTFGASGNWDASYGNVMLGALSRRFLDATGNDDHRSGWEYAVGVRPLLRAAPDVFVGADASYQARFPRGLNPTTLRAEDPAVVQLAPMVVLSPMGPSAYDRPQLRLLYRAAHLNDGARDEYVPDDPRHGRAWVHFLGFEAEWWFNSTYR